MDGARCRAAAPQRAVVAVVAPGAVAAVLWSSPGWRRRFRPRAVAVEAAASSCR
ncbi:MAG: hypothetical protein HS111_09280 [Kofleriaceae bacterium]|nr:hypothetical protein [Kofleriaceae bacterium]